MPAANLEGSISNFVVFQIIYVNEKHTINCRKSQVKINSDLKFVFKVVVTFQFHTIIAKDSADYCLNCKLVNYPRFDSFK